MRLLYCRQNGRGAHNNNNTLRVRLWTQDTGHGVMMLPLAGADTGAPLATPDLMSPGPGPLVTGNTFLMCPARLLLPWGQPGPDLTGVLVTNLDAWNWKEVRHLMIYCSVENHLGQVLVAAGRDAVEGRVLAGGEGTQLVGLLL